MELEAAKKLIKKYVAGHTEFIINAEIAERYYKKKNDILKEKYKKNTDAENPLREADNRIPSNFYKLQVNQKAAYAFTTPPAFDTSIKAANEVVSKTLGDAFAKKCKTLCVQAANSSVAWLHYWSGNNGEFKYAVIDSKQIIPIWTSDLEKELHAVMRIYTQIDENGNEYIVYEMWTDKYSQAFRRKADATVDELENYSMYQVVDLDTGIREDTDTYNHNFGEAPFIFFNNNDEMVSDLSDIKELIDAYDKVYSGFLNDLDDIQEIVFVLTNYGGSAKDAAGVLKEMHDKKVINVESDGPDDKSGVSTLAIEIPVAAREKMLSLTRKAVFEQGMAIDPDPVNFGDSSGVALRYLYSLLELKTGMMQTEFMISFNRLIRAILKFYNCKADKIVQTWTRTSVNNDAELADIAQKSKGVISSETIARNHPWVKDPEEELKRLKEQREETEPEWDKVPPVKVGDPNGDE